MLEIPFVLRVPPVTTRPERTLGSVIITVFCSSFTILLIVSILARMRIFFEMCGIFPVVIKQRVSSRKSYKCETIFILVARDVSIRFRLSHKLSCEKLSLENEKCLRNLKLGCEEREALTLRGVSYSTYT